MITYIYGDIFYSPARVLVNPVNTVGSMGSGLSQDFKRFFPEMFEQYRELCQRDGLGIGQLLLYRTPHKWILNFPTRRHFRAESSLEFVEEGLKKFVLTYADHNITSVSFPTLGTGEEGLKWEDVRPLMEAYLNPLPLSIYIHLEDGSYEDERRSTRAMRNWLNGQPRNQSFEQFWKEVTALLKGNDESQSFAGHIPFRIAVTQSKGRQRISLKIMPKRGDNIFLPETQLRDLWQYVSRVGYILPQNLPAGLEEHAVYIMTLLSQLPNFRPVQMAHLTGEVFVGLQYIPPIDQKSDITEIKL
jgi:O-acetyl-ADP-ribose deacetylase (regulator of RNase III)